MEPIVDQPPMAVSTPSFASVFRLIDTKTRRTDSLPPHDDTLSARVQLMLYRRLLCNLLSLSSPFDFPSLWKRLRLNPSAPFSDRFLIQAGLVFQVPKICCLNDLSAAWLDTISQPGVPLVDSMLEIIYRLQPQGSKWARKKGGGPQPLQETHTIHQEDIDLAKAIQASLEDLARVNKTIQEPGKALNGALDGGDPFTSNSSSTLDSDVLPLPIGPDPSLRNIPNGVMFHELPYLIARRIKFILK